MTFFHPPLSCYSPDFDQNSKVDFWKPSLKGKNCFGDICPGYVHFDQNRLQENIVSDRNLIIANLMYGWNNSIIFCDWWHFLLSLFETNVLDSKCVWLKFVFRPTFFFIFYLYSKIILNTKLFLKIILFQILFWTLSKFFLKQKCYLTLSVLDVRFFLIKFF